ncbi:ribonuclease H-like domain-containing protein [Tanacetum coccineum]
MSDHIPFEIQSEIIKRLPVKSVAQCRSVSKLWKSLIDSSEFISSYHTCKTQPQHHLFIRYKLANELKYVSVLDDDSFPNHKSSLTVPQPVSHLQYILTLTSVNGLLCFYGSRQAVLWNPSIGKAVGVTISNSLRIPDGHTCIGFGVCPNTSDPKLVRINTIGFPTVLNWEVEAFTLSARVWKTVSNIPPTFRTCHLTSNHVFVEGFIYWHAYDTSKLAFGIWSNLIISFDLKSDEFGEVCLPDQRNPLHLHANDSNYASIVSVRLNGVGNYRIWASKINTFKHGGLSVSEYYHKLNSLWKEFDILTKMPDCTCEARTELVNHGKLLKLIQFLMGLDDIYQPIRNSLLTREILREVKDAFVINYREESHREIPPSSVKFDNPHVSAFVSRQTDNNKNRSDNNLSNNDINMKIGNYDNLLCKNYGLKGHIIDRCFEITGYPSGFKRNTNLKPTNSFNNNKSNNIDSKRGYVGNSDLKTSVVTVSFTNEQVMKLMSILNDKSCSTPQANMIEANQHMTNSTKDTIDLVDVYDLKLSVGHLNRTLAKITHVGNLKLNNDSILFNVLVVLEYIVSLCHTPKMGRNGIRTGA